MNYTFQISQRKEISSNQLYLETIDNLSQFDVLYQPLIEELKNTLIQTGSGELMIKMDSLNVLRARTLFNLFKFLQLQNSLGAILKITWKVPLHNIKMLETAMDFAELYELQIAISID
ncbi:MAG: hypothetical protein CMP48_22485 [Rickettsiales bacterium]|nr:hypothetical protein [Rickettsiales bacterium]